MKALYLLLGAITLCTLAARASDIRTINGKSVDLQPIHDWEENQEGERPLKHWKEIEILDWVAQGPHGHPVATVRIGAQQKQIWLKHCPKEVLQDLVKVAEMEHQHAAAQEQAMADAAAAEAAKFRAEHTFAVAGDRMVVNAVLNQQQANIDAAANAKAAATRSAANVEKLAADIKLARAKLAAEAKVLALDTGSVFSSMPIWDTGLVGH